MLALRSLKSQEKNSMSLSFFPIKTCPIRLSVHWGPEQGLIYLVPELRLAQWETNSNAWPKVLENVGQHQSRKAKASKYGLYFLDQSFLPRNWEGKRQEDPGRHLLSLGLPREMGSLSPSNDVSQDPAFQSSSKIGQRPDRVGTGSLPPSHLLGPSCLTCHLFTPSTTCFG